MELDHAVLTSPQLHHALRIEFGRARRYAYPISCIVVSFDGPALASGDRSDGLRESRRARLAAAIRQQLRASDLMGHYQDRFALVLPHADERAASVVAARLRSWAEREAAGPLPAAASSGLILGIATAAPQNLLFVDTILRNAEAAWQAAAEGRRVAVDSGSPAGCAG